MKKLKIVFLSCFFFCGVVFGEDVQPPVWRCQESTTWQYWDFLTPDDGGIEGLVPDGPGPLSYPDGGYLPSTKAWMDPAPGMEWLSEDYRFEYEPGKEVGIGVWPLSGWVDILVDNHDPNPDNEKWMWVQVTWRPMLDGGVPVFLDIDPTPMYEPIMVQEIPLGPEWRETTYEWKLDSNPPYESFSLGGAIHLDEIVIDTWCIPEPSTVVLLSLGVFATMRRRRF